MVSLTRRVIRSEHPACVFLRRAYRALRAFSLPSPRWLVRPMLWGYLSIRTCYWVLKRVLICEPLFKAYCTRYGRGLQTGVYVHWVQGSGEIILGDHVLVDGKCSFAFAYRYSDRPRLEIGDHTIISHGCSFTVGKQIRIGRNCMIAMDTWLADSSGHSTDPAARLAGLPAPDEKVRPITIGDNVWIGTRCVILPGSSIGEGSVISSMSVVRGEIPPYTVAAGNPARPVATLTRPATAESGGCDEVKSRESEFKQPRRGAMVSTVDRCHREHSAMDGR